MAIEACIFDLDGTLLDSAELWSDIDRQFLGKRGFAVPEDYQSAVALMTPEQSAEYTIRRFGLSDTPEQLAREIGELALRAYRETIGLLPGAERYVRECRAKGLKIALATASPPEFYIPALRRCGIYDLFDLCLCSSGSLFKGDPEFYRIVADGLGVRCSRCEVYDDVYANIIAAADAGMKTCFLSNNLFNYGIDSFPRADRIITSFLELLP